MSDLYDNLAKLQALSREMEEHRERPVQNATLALVIDLIVAALPEITND